jgi:gluconokinase
VVTCSALKQAYRARLLAARPAVRLLYLHGSAALIAARQAARPDHFMPASLMASQFATLEAPGPGEAALTLSVEDPPAAIVARACVALGARDGVALGASATPGAPGPMAGLAATALSG